MRNLKFIPFYKVAALLAIFVIFSSSCKKDNKKDNPNNLDYVGAWITMDSTSTDYGYVESKDILTLTETSRTNLIQAHIPIPIDFWIDYASLKASISVNGNIMDGNVTEVGIVSVNTATGLPTGKMTIYKEGTTEFDTLLSGAGQSKTFKSEYSVAGNKLTIKTDINKDGDFLDAKETRVYTK